MQAPPEAPTATVDHVSPPAPTGEILAEESWAEALAEVQARVVMLVGGCDTGKSTFARFLAREWCSRSHRVAVVAADVGQPSVGVPTCMSLAEWDDGDLRSRKSWFVGDTSPVGSLLQTAVGAGRLVQLARERGNDRVIIDTSGFIGDAQARMLKFHKAVACGVDWLIGIARGVELDPLLSALHGICPNVSVFPASTAVRPRSQLERRASRQERFARALRGGQSLRIESQKLIARDFSFLRAPLKLPGGIGLLAGFVGVDGYCQGLALVEAIDERLATIFAAGEPPSGPGWYQLGKIFLDRSGQEVYGRDLRESVISDQGSVPGSSSGIADSSSPHFFSFRVP